MEPRIKCMHRAGPTLICTLHDASDARPRVESPSKGELRIASPFAPRPPPSTSCCCVAASPSPASPTPRDSHHNRTFASQ